VGYLVWAQPALAVVVEPEFQINAHKSTPVVVVVH
jgi:hypothetical protein